MRILSTFLLSLALAGGLYAQDPPEDVGPNEDSTGSAEDIAAIEAVVNAWRDGQNAGDNDAVMALIAEDALFLEGGGLEDYEQYRDNHLPADIEFEEQVNGVREFMRVTVEGDTAWVVTTHYYDGEFDGNPLFFNLATLWVMSREDDGWKIRAINWSSR